MKGSFIVFRNRSWLSLILIALLLWLIAAPAVAHERREVGEYELVFGWRVEPALVGYPNGPEMMIRPPGETEAAELPAVSLQVEISFGPATTTLAMRPMFGETDHYIADLIPTRPGDYSFRVFGTIGDVEIDEVFTSADGEFSSVEPAGDVTFPDALPSVVDLLERIAELEARLAALEGGS